MRRVWADAAPWVLVSGLISCTVGGVRPTGMTQADQTPARTASPSGPPTATQAPFPSPIPQFGPGMTLRTGGYGLTGRLLVIQYDSDGNRLLALDMASGMTTMVFQAPPRSWLGEALASPDGRWVLLAYAPPPPPSENQFGYTGLYLLPADGSAAPMAIRIPERSGEAYFYPAWDADGRSFYATHLHPTDSEDDETAVAFDIERIGLDGSSTTVVRDALWPALSRDGSRLAYLAADPDTGESELYVSNADGAQARAVFPSASLPPIDAHLFSSDGSSLLFSMVNASYAPTSSWWERLLGIETASAHSIPSDWYVVSTGGGNPERLTYTQEVGLMGDLSPDGIRLAFIGAGGLYLVPVRRGEVLKLTDAILIGTVDWIP